MHQYLYRFLCKALSLSMLCSLSISTYAFFHWGEKDPSTVENFSKQIIIGDSFHFSPEDFHGKEGLVDLQISSLPDPSFGILAIGQQPIKMNEIIGISAISGLTFQSNKKIGTTEFVLTPSYSDGSQGEAFTITLHLLNVPNQAPTAKDMDLYTYKNIEITSYFDAIDSEGDPLTFQIVDPPARGAIILPDNGTSSFLYTPYENKTGKDSFRYIATDPAGNTSNQGLVTIRIEKAETTVKYGDMEGHPAHKAAIHLAEEGIYVGELVGNTHLFHPDTPVTREEFLSLAMAAAHLDPLSNVTTTGFYDDFAIETWSKGYISSALLAGVIQGDLDENGRPVFNPAQIITQGEASVMLNHLLDLTHVENSGQHWASQASANLTAAGIVSTTNAPLPTSLTRGEVAQLLDGALSANDATKNRWSLL